MIKKFYVGNKFLTDTRVEPLFDVIIPESKVRLDGSIQYTGQSQLFDHIKGDVAKIGYRAGEFRAFEANEIEDGWIFLDQKNDDFDSEIILGTEKDLPDAGKGKKEKLGGFIPPTPATESGDELSEEDLKEAAQEYYKLLMSREITLAAVKDREKLFRYLKYQQLYALAQNTLAGFNFDAKKAGGRKLSHVKDYLMKWESDTGLE